MTREIDEDLYIKIHKLRDGTPALDLSFHFGMLLGEIEMTYDRSLCEFVIPLFTFVTQMQQAGVLDKSKYTPPTFFIHNIRLKFDEERRVITVYYVSAILVELPWKMSSIYILLTKLPRCTSHTMPPIVDGSMVLFPQASSPKLVNRITWKSSNIYSIGDLYLDEIPIDKKTKTIRQSLIENVTFKRVVDLYFSQSQPYIDPETGEWRMNGYLPVIEILKVVNGHHRMIFVDPDIKYKLQL